MVGEPSSDEEINDITAEPLQKKRRVSFSLKRKLEILEFSKKNSKTYAEKTFGVNRSTIRGWELQEKQLKEEVSRSTKAGTQCQLPGSGRRLLSKDLDDELAEWVRINRANKIRVSRRMIQLQSLAIANRMVKAEQLEPDSFRGSIGWLAKFMNRHGLSVRLPTTVCQKPPSEYAQKLTDFVMFTRRLRRRRHYLDSGIYAADETAVWLDPAGGKCVDRTGVKEVSVLTSGHDKMHVTVMLTGKSDGTKCRPYVLLPRKRPDADIVKQFRNKLVLSWSGTVWMNDVITEDYLQKILGRFAFGNRLLVWDAFRCHLSVSTKSTLKALKLDTAIVPGGCTKFIQAPDVFWNGPFKAKIKQYYEQWMLNGEKTYTTGNNMRPPLMEVYLQWIVDAWESLPREAIAKSFKVCGISNAVDGSEDHEIHCFKENGPCPEGRALLSAAQLDAEIEEIDLASIHLSEIDPEEDAENGYASDNSVVSA